MRKHAILQPRGAEVRFLEVVVALAVKEFERRCPKLTSRKIRKINSWTHVFIHESVTLCVTRYSAKYGRFTAPNIPKCEHFTLLVCPLRFLVISAVRRLGNVQSFKTCIFRF